MDFSGPTKNSILIDISWHSNYAIILAIGLSAADSEKMENQIWKVIKPLATNNTVDGRNPAPPGMYKTLPNNGINYLSTGAGFLPSVCSTSKLLQNCLNNQGLVALQTAPKRETKVPTSTWILSLYLVSKVVVSETWNSCHLNLIGYNGEGIGWSLQTLWFSIRPCTFIILYFFEELHQILPHCRNLGNALSWSWT